MRLSWLTNRAVLKMPRHHRIANQPSRLILLEFSKESKRRIHPVGASMASSIIRRSLSSLPHPLPSEASETLVSSVVSIMKHHRSKSRWNEIRTLYPAGFTPSEVTQIILQVRNNPHLALNFFHFTVRRSLCDHTLVSYAAIIHTLARSRLKPHALTLIQSALREFPDDSESSSPQTPKLFEILVKSYRECNSAPFVFDLLIKACLRSRRIDQATEIVRLLRSRGIFPTVSTCNSLIRSVSKFSGCFSGYDLFKEVFGVYDESKTRLGGAKIVPNEQTFNVILLAFYQDGLTQEMREIWREMEGFGFVPNAYSYSILMAGCCDDIKMDEALKLWEEMERKGLKHDSVTYDNMIGGFCRIGEVGRAEELFKEMGLNDLETSSVTFEHLINGYCRIGDVDSALMLYKDMCRNGFRTENHVIDAVVRGLCGKGRVSEALKFLRDAMSKNDLLASEKSYEVLIKGLCQDGRLEEALKLQSEMVGKGFEPSSDIYCAFIDANTKQGNYEMAETLRKEMLETRVEKEENL